MKLIILCCAFLITAVPVEWATAFWRAVRKAGGVRELKAELTGTASPAAPAPAPAAPAVPWWLKEDAGLGAKPTPRAACWEPATPAPTAGVPPWDPAAPSLNTGHSLYHIGDLRELLGRDAS